MATKSTIFKAEIQVTDLDRQYYESHSLTIARHPSETDERMMLRLIAFCFHAHEHLSLTKGLSTDEEPDLWQKSLSGEIELWIELGQPDEKRIRQACGKAKQVVIYCYQHRSASIWWEKIRHKLDRFKNLSILNLDNGKLEELSSLVSRNMQLQCTIQDGEIWLTDTIHTFHITHDSWKDSSI